MHPRNYTNSPLSSTRGFADSLAAAFNSSTTIVSNDPISICANKMGDAYSDAVLKKASEYYRKGLAPGNKLNGAVLPYVCLQLSCEGRQESFDLERAKSLSSSKPKEYFNTLTFLRSLVNRPLSLPIKVVVVKCGGAVDLEKVEQLKEQYLMQRYQVDRRSPDYNTNYAIISAAAFFVYGKCVRARLDRAVKNTLIDMAETTNDQFNGIVEDIEFVCQEYLTQVKETAARHAKTASNSRKRKQEEVAESHDNENEVVEEETEKRTTRQGTKSVSQSPSVSQLNSKLNSTVNTPQKHARVHQIAGMHGVKLSSPTASNVPSPSVNAQGTPLAEIREHIKVNAFVSPTMGKSNSQTTPTKSLLDETRDQLDDSPSSRNSVNVKSSYKKRMQEEELSQQTKQSEQKKKRNVSKMEDGVKRRKDNVGGMHPMVKIMGTSFETTKVYRDYVNWKQKILNMLPVE